MVEGGGLCVNCNLLRNCNAGLNKLSPYHSGQQCNVKLTHAVAFLHFMHFDLSSNNDCVADGHWSQQGTGCDPAISE